MFTSLEESGRRAGGNRWIESRLFEVVGAWVPVVTDVPARLLFDRHSFHHAWRAGQWWDRLPVLADVDRQELCAPPSPAWQAGLDELAALTPAEGGAAALYRVVLPRLHSRYRRQHDQCGEAGDSSFRRTLQIVRADLAADWQEGEEALEELLSAPGPLASAAQAQVAVESALISGSS